MGAVLSLEGLLDTRHVWRGRPVTAPAADGHPTGLATLDDALPQGGWPRQALTEILLAGDGIGELRLLWPAVSQITQAGGTVVLVAPPYVPHAPAWHRASIDLLNLHVIHADRRDALWATEQCMRSGACDAVVCWPWHADDRALRRLQVAAETGQCLGFAFRPLETAANPSPAALRIAIDGQPRQLRVLKCRGAMPPTRPIPFNVVAH
jgi:hypothetical protein